MRLARKSFFLDMKRISLVLAILVSLVLVGLNLRLNSHPTGWSREDPRRDRDVVAQLRFVREAIDDGAAQRMQTIYPEGFFFLHTVYGLAWAELALSSTDPTLREPALRESRRALQAIESPEGTRVFPPDIAPRLGVAYLGWTNCLRGRILQLQGAKDRDTAIWARFEADLAELAMVYDTAPSPFQQSYARMSWPGDNAVPMAAFRLHDKLAGTPTYGALVDRWVAKVKTRLEPATGMPPFEMSFPSDTIVRSTRGGGQTMMLRFLAEVDPEFAKSQYMKLREVFYARRVGLPLVREYPVGAEGEPDYDSGPVVWGIGASATIVSLGTARAFGDTAWAEALEQTIDFYGEPYEKGGRRVYALGLMPVADAFLAWSKVALPDPLLVQTRPSMVGMFWCWPIHLVSLGLAALSWLPWLLLKRRRKHALGA